MEAGIGVEDQLVSVCEAEQDGFSEWAGYRSMKRLLELNSRPDGVFATSDVQALGALRAIEEAGLSVPGDIAVVGFDDIPLLRYAGLSTLRQPMSQLGSSSIERLLLRMEKPTLEVEHTVLSPELVVGRTTAGQEKLRVRKTP